jgi:glycerate 2-kinase
VLALISGGGSALLEAPRPPVTLDDLARTTDLLLRAGAPIQDLNAVRIPLSLVKGGGLRRAAGQATMVTLILSDVLGNDMRIIASGPTVRGNPSGQAALALLDRYRVRDHVPPTILNALASISDMSATWEYLDDVVEIVADNETALGALREHASAEGRRVEIIWTRIGGETADLGRQWVEVCAACKPGVDVLLGGGEATVTVRGDGIGGRNTEFALAAALELERRGLHEWTVASLATDGQDGPTNVAGAIADARTCARSREAGVDPQAALANNDSLRVFEAAGGVVAPGPTGTNVNDLYIAVRDH